MAKTVSLRNNTCTRGDSPALLVDQSQFTGDLDIYVENTGDFALLLSQSGGGIILRPGRSVKFHVEAPIDLSISAAQAADANGITYDFRVNANAVIEGEVL